MRKRYFIVGVSVAGVAALVIAAAGLARVGSSSATPLPASSCGPLQYGGSGSPQFIVPSDLPLQGSSRAQLIEMSKAIAYTFKQAGYKAGKYTVGYQSCDDSTAQAGKWDPAKCSANAGNYVRDKTVIGVIGTFNSGCAEIEAPILNRAPGGGFHARRRLTERSKRIEEAASHIRSELDDLDPVAKAQVIADLTQP